MPLRDPPRVLLVGECNPYGGGDEFSLVPFPDGCSGHRLCTLILHMGRKRYMEVFDRTNLCVGRWYFKDARPAAEELRSLGKKIIALGAKVCSAFRIPYIPFGVVSDILVLPHPSGLCRLWNEPGAFEAARVAVRLFAPELSRYIGEQDAEE